MTAWGLSDNRNSSKSEELQKHFNDVTMTMIT